MTTDHEPATSTVWDECETFRNLGHFVNHWERPGWTEHTETYHWFLTFDAADNLHRLTEQCQVPLDGIPTLDLVPPTLLHLTIERVGFVEDVASDELNAIVDAGRRGCSKLSPFSLNIGPLTGSAGAIRFSVTPHDPIKELRDLLDDAGTDVLGKEDDNPAVEKIAPYVPHVSIAYSNADVLSAPVVSQVGPLRGLGSVEITIGRVDLVQLRRENRLYVWDPIATLELGV